MWSKEVPTERGWYWMAWENPLAKERGYDFTLGVVYFNSDWWHYGGMGIDLKGIEYFMPLVPPTLPTEGISYPPATPPLPPSNLRDFTWRVLWHWEGEAACWRTAEVHTSILDKEAAQGVFLSLWESQTKTLIVDVVSLKKEGVK